MLYKKIIPLLIIVLGLTEIAYGQSLTPDSCIYYTPEQDIRCLKCLINEPKKDSIIVKQSAIIQNLKKEVVNYTEQINTLDTLVAQKNNQINTVSLKLEKVKKRNKTNLISGLSIGSIGVFLLQLLLN